MDLGAPSGSFEPPGKDRKIQEGKSPGKEEVKDNVVILDYQKEDSEQRKSSWADMVEKDTLESSGEKTIVDNSNMKEKVNGWNSVSPDKAKSRRKTYM
ncbi:hypothetical protein DY000_02020481 [Brassica cretica]|uniref:Uncharacterized protein n=1 Tax=Brassica cretica TaxID=69181 RepID=A0ABQ7E265_BRACR|nr:hypothetical protein DY000_02020481 [Brassica cretica]